MSLEAEELYALLPAVYRTRDAEQGEPLKQLVSVLAEQVAFMQEDVDQLYDDQFIETCASWVVPYIGDLIGFRPLHTIPDARFSGREEVANTIRYRRRKGTATVLEQLARDVTVWNARAVEYFRNLWQTQYMNHIRVNGHNTVSMRHWQPLVRIDTAFDSFAHNIEVRRIPTKAGRYNIPNVGLFLWRLEDYRIRRSPAVRIDARRYMFSPLGNNMQLFNRAAGEVEITHIAEPINVPEAILRRLLHEQMQLYYGAGLSVFVEIEGLDTSMANIKICNLSDLPSPPNPAGSWAHTPVTPSVDRPQEIALDPVLGRLAFADDQPPDRPVLVTYHTAFSMPVGGGEYERSQSFDIDQTADETLINDQLIQPALDTLTNGGILELLDSGRFEQTPAITASSGTVELRAANEHRPSLVLSGDLDIAIAPNATAVINGLSISGGTLRIPSDGTTEVRTLRLRHCTLVPGLELNIDGAATSPGTPSLIVEQAGLHVEIDHCIVGAIRSVAGTQLNVSNSAIDANHRTNVALSAPDDSAESGETTLINCTVIGKMRVRKFDLVSNCILEAALAVPDTWDAPIQAEQTQDGCIRYSYVPQGSITPRRFHCEPDLALEKAIKRATGLNPLLTVAEEAQIRQQVLSALVPTFTSREFSQPAYLQLAPCPEEIHTGADDESEMGIFHNVFAAQREANLRIRLEEYLRFRLEAGILHAT